MVTSPKGSSVIEKDGVRPADLRRQGCAIQADVVARLGTIAKLGGFAIDGDPAGADPLLNGAARSVAGAGQQFLKS